MPIHLKRAGTKYEQVVYEALKNMGNKTDTDAWIYAWWLEKFLTEVQAKSQGHFVYTNQLIDVLRELLPAQTPPSSAEEPTKS